MAKIELTDAECDVADKIESAMDRADNGLTPSGAARAGRCDYATARKILDYLVEGRRAHVEGNGCRQRWYSGTDAHDTARRRWIAERAS